MKFKIRPTINHHGKMEYYIKKKKLLCWVDEKEYRCSVMGCISYSLYFKSPQRAHRHILEKYGTSAKIIRWK